jgi:hypothetical protein
VDYVARAITYSSLNPDQTAGKLFHLCSGPKASIPIPALVDRVRNGLGSNGDVKTRAIPSSVFRRSLSVMAWFANERGRKALRNLPLFLDYLDFPQQFSNARSEAFFNEQGIELPLFSDYLPAVLDFYGKNRPVPVSG